jgi:hypothetical protein
MLTFVEPMAVRITVENSQPAAPGGHWRVTWLVHNDGAAPLRLDDAWVPHGRFRGEGHVPLDMRVEPGGVARLELNVWASEAAGSVVDNAYLILRTPAWRYFARMHVSFDADGKPAPVVETVTTQYLQ